LGVVIIAVWLPYIRNKEKSISRYAEFGDYKANPIIYSFSTVTLFRFWPTWTDQETRCARLGCDGDLQSTQNKP